MRILVTRPRDAAVRTAERLAALGHEAVIDPLLVLRFAPPDDLLGDADPDAVVMTSANAAQAVAGHADLARLTGLPLWTVGSRTSAAARALGFSAPRGEAPDLYGLAALLRTETPKTLLHLAAEVRAGDLSALAPQHRIITCVVYGADPAAALAEATAAALRGGAIDAVLHYSRRLAETYAALARVGGLAAEGLAPRQLCLSEQVAAPLRAAGARNVAVAAEPREDALLALLG